MERMTPPRVTKIEAARNTATRVVLIARPEDEGLDAAQILAVLEGETL